MMPAQLAGDVAASGVASGEPPEAAGPNYWCFRVDPARYDIKMALQTMETEVWRTHKSQVRKGDLVAFWQNMDDKGRRGIVGFAEVLDDPIERPDSVSEPWRGEPLPPAKRVKLALQESVNGPLWVGGPDDALLRGLSVAKARGGSIFRLTAEQWVEISQVAGVGNSNSVTDSGEKSPPDRRVLVEQRQGQPEFRRQLIQAYGGRCAVTGCGVEPALQAAHIRPYRESKENHVSNGLLLRADIHNLFDSDVLWVRVDDWTVRIADTLRGTEYEDLLGKPLRMPKREADWPAADLLSQDAAGKVRRDPDG